MTNLDLLPPGFDPTDPDINEKSFPHDEFRALRANAPIHWVEQVPEARAGFFGSGYWAVSRHQEVREVSKNNDDWSTAENGVIIRFAPDMTRDQVEVQRAMLIHHDPPDHTKMRGIVSRGFTPRAIASLKDALRERAHRIVEDAVAKGSGDFVEDLAAELPLQAIADFLGVPQEDRKKLFEWSNQMMAYDDPDFDVDPAVASMEILGYFDALANDRRENPRDDIVTKLVSVGQDDDHGALTNDEFGFFVILLTVAGNETTRNAISHGMHAFFQNPDQWELWRTERPETMVDEVIRWATPVTVFQRTAKRDTELAGQAIAKGDRVGLFYASANFDESVFDDPFRFDIRRDPNPHVAFGGHGAHYCIGANLARMEVKLIFEALADIAPGISQAGEPRRLRSGWLNAIKEMQVTYQ
ncbi:cytochrome P450 [Nocardioides sp. TF02-7]|uniref:cytochrome P450 n=1 Tax=Nocardioides sp. TF02-7 TaxID=2917724 RepID=UPI001F06C33A|nr:cytochrome P450 [Nocardioides sp. TF02-7]UMG92374.1 cytochrome P450 [Nocardioides sp. TF02-7]